MNAFPRGWGPLPDLLARYADRQARRIGDPIKRLRYLRTVMTAQAALNHSIPPSRLLWPAFLGAFFLLFYGLTGEKFEHPGTPKPNAILPDLQADTLLSFPSGMTEVWLVERAGKQEIYSNGLRVEQVYETANEPRSYLAFARDPKAPQSSKTSLGPAGIVFHTTESNLAPFTGAHNEKLKRYGQYLLEHVRKGRLYHYVIDRFGRVFRIVLETDAANHAGNSIWADAQWIYVDLNYSFLAVSFEARTTGFGETTTLSRPQIHAARLLTEMLRGKYKISDRNCVTHAQVSVNPDAKRIGNHRDWIANFPFVQIGLPDNYETPLPSVVLFGFRIDAEFLLQAGAGLSRGLHSSGNQIKREAEAQGLTEVQYRFSLQKRYKNMIAAMKEHLAATEVH